MNLSDVEFIMLLPLFMRDDEANIALSNAVNTLIRDPGSRVKHLRVWDQIDNLDHPDLDELAWELNVGWYSTEMSLEAKRQTIKYAQRIQAKRGTKWAVVTALCSVFPNTEVQEWYEYGGTHHRFRVILDITNAQIPVDYVEITKLLKYYSRASAHLDYFVVKQEFEQTDYHAGAMAEYISEYMSAEPELPTYGISYHAGAMGEYIQTIYEG